MRSNRFTPLGRKLVAAILGTSLLALVLSFALNLISVVHSYEHDVAERARSLASLMASSLAVAVDFDDAGAAVEDLSSLALVPNVTGAAVYVNGGSLFASYGRTPPPPREGEDASGVEMHMSTLTVTRAVGSASPGTWLVVSQSLEDQWSSLWHNLLIAVGILAIVFAVCIRVALFFRRRLADPLAELGSAVADISRSKDYSRRVEYRSEDEVGMLVAGFNAMLEKIAKRDAELRGHREFLEQMVDERTHQLERNRRELERKNLMLVAEIRRRTKAEMIREEVERINRHDLKSSLSLVIGYPELLLREGGLNSQQEKGIKRIRAAGYRMLDMIQNHLDMFKMEHGIYTLRRMKVDLVEVVCTLEEEFAPLLGSLGVTLDIELDGVDVVGAELFEIRGEEPLLRAMLRNLMQNAIEASRQGDTVAVRMESGVRQRISVYNPTPVPNEIRNRVFDKYVTFGKENGTGLGTYFAALIARTHGATIAMHTDDAAGTLMTVVFKDSEASAGVGRRAAEPRSLLGE
jgi:signal transduction histidine kinase